MQRKEIKSDLTEKWSDEDGIDPRHIKKGIQNRKRKSKTDHSSLRLARQIENHLQVFFPVISAETMLTQFEINDVKPVGKGHSFVVQLYCTNPEFKYEIIEVQQNLLELKPRLRAEISKVIHRKNVPDLTFDVLPPNISPNLMK